MLSHSFMFEHVSHFALEEYVINNVSYITEIYRLGSIKIIKVLTGKGVYFS